MTSNIILGVEWVPVFAGLRDVFYVIITLHRGCRELKTDIVNAETNAVIRKNFDETDMVICTDRSDVFVCLVDINY